MRVRLRIGRALLLAAFFLFALVALLPMRLALDWLGFGERGLAARAATGSVWYGALQEAQVGPVPLGDVAARLNVLPLLLGRARLSLERSDEAGRLAGAVTVSRHGFGLDDVTGSFRLGPLLSPLPVATLDLDDLSAGFASGRCARAEGRIRANVTGEIAGLGLASGLTGAARCADDALLLPLASQSGMERLELRLFADGRYRAELLVRTADPAVGARLAAAGFRPAPGGQAMRIDGSF